MQNITKTILHVWIGLVSLAAFALSWIFVAHSQKPAVLEVPQVQVLPASQPALEPIPSINDLIKPGSGTGITFQSPVVTFPRLRTRGS